MISSEFAQYFEKFPCALNHYLGVYALDDLPSIVPVRNFLIFNLSKKSEVGTHWVCLVRPEKHIIEVFDPLGTKFHKISNFLPKQKKIKYVYNHKAFQEITSSTCGKFCIYFLVERMMNFDLSFKSVLIEIFDTSDSINETIVTNFCNSILS